MSSFSIILSVFLMLPYFGWGIYSLRVRYRHHDELSMVAEVTTLVAVAAFFVVELALLQRWMINSQILFIFTILGLLVSGTALYGPMLISVASQFFVDVMMPPESDEGHMPRFAPAEALERIGDYEGAVQECLIIARIFPKDPSTALRVADNLSKMGNFEEAAQWFERALENVSDSEKALGVTNRVAEIYLRRLDQRDDAIRVLENYIETFPDAERTESVRTRLHRIVESGPVAPSLPTSGALEIPPQDPSG